jgi:hypothetical protein
MAKLLPPVGVADGPKQQAQSLHSPTHCSLATPGASLFAHGSKHLANVRSQEVIHLVALQAEMRR